MSQSQDSTTAGNVQGDQVHLEVLLEWREEAHRLAEEQAVKRIAALMHEKANLGQRNTSLETEKERFRHEADMLRQDLAAARHEKQESDRSLTETRGSLAAVQQNAEALDRKLKGVKPACRELFYERNEFRRKAELMSSKVTQLETQNTQLMAVVQQQQAHDEAMITQLEGKVTQLEKQNAQLLTTANQETTKARAAVMTQNCTDEKHQRARDVLTQELLFPEQLTSVNAFLAQNLPASQYRPVGERLFVTADSRSRVTSVGIPRALRDMPAISAQIPPPPLTDSDSWPPLAARR